MDIPSLIEFGLGNIITLLNMEYIYGTRMYFFLIQDIKLIQIYKLWFDHTNIVFTQYIYIYNMHIFVQIHTSILSNILCHYQWNAFHDFLNKFCHIAIFI